MGYVQLLPETVLLHGLPVGCSFLTVDLPALVRLSMGFGEQPASLWSSPRASEESLLGYC